MRKLVWKLLSILVMILIFWFSNQNASASNLQSGWFYHLFHGHIQVWFIRKAAHMSIYALLAFCVYQAQEKPTIKTTLGIVILYACTDEFHQLFVNGRAGRFTDVLIDTSGGVIMLLIVFIISLAVLRRKKYN